MTSLKKKLEENPIQASTPCRIDMGGTLDISTFYYPLGIYFPCTFNISVDMRTEVTVFPHSAGKVKISSKGFKTAQFPGGQAPYNHPMGVMFAVADFFNSHGMHIHIESSSPPRSALGGSSSAVIALVAALLKIHGHPTAGGPLSREKIARLAHNLEASVARVPCGLQDQLAAVYGGVNAWYWHGAECGTPFTRKKVFKKNQFQKLGSHILLAYCGSTHVSADINNRWMRDFISGRYRKLWVDIVTCTRQFIHAVGTGNYAAAAGSMNREMVLRKKMTPDVLDDMGSALVRSAVKHQCGARFTGAGGGGCLWAIGKTKDINRLRPKWQELLSKGKTSRLLDFNIAAKGLIVHVMDKSTES